MVFFVDVEFKDAVEFKNAMALVEENAALLVKDADAKTDLWMAIETLINDKLLAEELGKNIKKLEKPLAAKGIVDEVFKLVKNDLEI